MSQEERKKDMVADKGMLLIEKYILIAERVKHGGEKGTCVY